jgi:hypothetical protein
MGRGGEGRARSRRNGDFGRTRVDGETRERMGSAWSRVEVGDRGGRWRGLRVDERLKEGRDYRSGI